MATITATAPPLRVSPAAATRHTGTMAWRQLVQIKHNPMELLDLSLMPIMFLLLFVYVFGGQMSGSTDAYLQYVLGGMIAQNGIFVTMNTGIGLNSDLRKGVYDRFRSLPIARSAPLAGKIIADMFKQAWSLLVLLVLGVVLGFNLDSFVGVIGSALLLVAFAVAVSWIAVLIGVVAESEEKVQIFSFVTIMPLTFTSSAFVDPSTMPGWMETWANINPVTHLANAVRGMLSGGEIGAEHGVAEPVLWTLVWAVVILAVFFPLAMRAYRKKMS